jgi:hypothetical protein
MEHHDARTKIHGNPQCEPRSVSVIEMSQSSWLVGGMLPGIERQPRKKLEPSPERLLAVLHRWRDEAVQAPTDTGCRASAPRCPRHR